MQGRFFHYCDRFPKTGLPGCFLPNITFFINNLGIFERTLQPIERVARHAAAARTLRVTSCAVADTTGGHQDLCKTRARDRRFPSRGRSRVSVLAGEVAGPAARFRSGARTRMRQREEMFPNSMARLDRSTTARPPSISTRNWPSRHQQRHRLQMRFPLGIGEDCLAPSTQPPRYAQ
jgi:hypothetical protein